MAMRDDEGELLRREVPEIIREWLARKADRKPITLAAEHVLIRQLCPFRRRRDAEAYVPPRALALHRPRASAAPLD